MPLPAWPGHAARLRHLPSAYVKTTGPTTFRRARAKLNLRLEVGKRSGRLHTLVSVIATLRLADVLRFSPCAQGFAVRTRGYDIREEDNLVWRAVHELGFGAPAVCITIKKYIPLQAGLGGGSADAAAALLGIAQMAMQNGAVVSASTVREAAARVGSDVPSALVPGLKIVAGTGELVTPYRCENAPRWGIVLLKPRVGSDTSRAYALLDEQQVTRDLDGSAFDRARAVCAAFSRANFHEFLELAHNDFSTVIKCAIPAVKSAQVRLEQAGASGTLLCGSGSCVAGFFESIEAARLALSRVSLDEGDWIAVTAFDV
jgi:4-diphosphocytidyl-2-C-methyl-D-erythritol kinase